MNIFQYLNKKLNPFPKTVPAHDAITVSKDNSEFNQDIYNKVGIIQSDLNKLITDQTLISYERSQLYRNYEEALNHPLMSAACGLFADTACVYNKQQNATVWVTAENKEYQKQIEKLFEIIDLEEVIYDWAWSLAAMGDVFIQLHGEPGIGIVSISDDQHPINVSRVDYGGRLIGFYETPAGYSVADTRKLLPPWEYLHMRLLGAKKRRPVYGMGNQGQYSEYRSISIMTPDPRRLTSKYGTSVLLDALPIWKRLRLAEDSVLMARISRGVLRYLYRIAIPEDNANSEAVANLIDNYVSTLKRARSLNLEGSSNKNYQDRFSGLAGMEDIIIPVWGDVNGVQIDKLGGEVDIKWITDIEELRNQLSTALKVPLSLLSGYGKEAPPSLGNGSGERLDIRFARQSRRIQRALISGLTRMAQIHLAYQGMDPDLNMFQIQMSETSTAEEIELQEALERGVGVVSQIADFINNSLGSENIDQKELLDYLNKKFLKLNDMDLDKLLLKANPDAFIGKGNKSTKPLTPGNTPFTGARGGEEPTEMGVEGGEEESSELPAENPFRESKMIGDFKAALPKDLRNISLNEKENKIIRTDNTWEENWGNTVVKIKPVKNA